MRASLWFGLLALGLIAASIRVSTAAPRGPRGAPPAAAPAPDASRVCEGYGLTADDAKEDALKNAQAYVVEFLDRTYGRLGWNPSADQLTQAGVVQWEGAPVERKLGSGEVVQVARARVEITPKYRQEVDRQAHELERLARQQRSQHRHFLLARVFGGLVVLCVVVAGYLRLEDLTRGYYTRLLRLAALTVLAVTAAALALVA
jgi:hypothetical protein